jgi:tetratricopeptide (TPR) repeat protein
VAIAHGLTQRLAPPQQLAIGAHEIAHIRSGSLWWLMGGFPLGLALGFSSLFFVPEGTAAGLALCLGVLVPRMWLSRATELLCDRMAAEWTSPEDLRAGLSRLHAVHPVDLSSFWGRAAYSLATHPPLPVRLAALGDTQTDAQAHRVAAALGQGLLLTLLGAAVFFQLGFWAFLLLTLTPTLLLSLGAKAAIQRQRKRMPGQRNLWVWGVVPLLASLVWLLRAIQAGEGILWPVLLMLVLEIIILPMAWRHRKRSKVLKSLSAALAARDFESIWALRSTQAKQLFRDPALNHDVLAVGVVLDKFGAAKELQELIPRFPQAGLTLADILVYRDPQASLLAGEALSERLPQDAGGAVAMGRALIALGELDLAQGQLVRAQELQGGAAAVLLEAELALAQERFALCHTQLQRAEELAPGDPWLVLLRADLALTLGELDQAQADLEHVAETLVAMPVQGMSVRLEQLRERLSASQGPADADAEE